MKVKNVDKLSQRCIYWTFMRCCWMFFPLLYGKRGKRHLTSFTQRTCLCRTRVIV